MKQHIVRFSPHQNGKVLAMLLAFTSLIFLLPFVLIMYTTMPAVSRPPLLMFLVMPVIYLVFGYVAVSIGCAIYNFLFRFTGGIEFESRVEGE